MNDMTKAIVPKSDQLNSDDLIGCTKTITITRVAISGGKEQPVSIYYEGDNGKPYKPCKGMCRVMVMAWGADASQYVGRSMTLYRDPSVTWAGMEVGGIRISHMSHIEDSMVMAITANKKSRKSVTVKPLKQNSAPPPPEKPASTGEESAGLAVGAEPYTTVRVTDSHVYKAIQEAYKNASAALKGRFSLRTKAYQSISDIPPEKAPAVLAWIKCEIDKEAGQ